VIWKTDCLIKFVILLVVSIYTLVFYALRRGNNAIFLASKTMRHDNDKDWERSRSLAILIQQSPVDPRSQIARLTVIDNSFASWSVMYKEVSIFAAVDAADIGTQGLQNLRVISIKDYSKGTAMYRLVYALYTMLKDKGSFGGFIIICNDHSFIVVPNLVEYLKEFDPNNLFYTGNELAISYKGSTLSFASGGAGIVVSKSCISLMIVTWAIIRLPILVEIMSRKELLEKCVLQEMLDSHSVLFETEELICSMNLILKLSDLAATSGLTSVVLRDIFIRLSPSVTVIVTLKEISVPTTESADLFILKIDEGLGKRDISVASLTSCTAVSTWELANPGIILAHCLSKVYNIKFTDSRSRDGLERFHVYGVVRSVTNNIDSWYVDSKSLLRRHMQREKVIGIPLDKHPISFHYVSSVESMLLYMFFEGKRVNKTSFIYPAPSEIYKMWPKTNKDVGHYSEPLKSFEEAKVLSEYISNITIAAC
jgi:hypothetical protein